MRAVSEALELLDADASMRVIRWATERFGGMMASEAKGPVDAGGNRNDSTGNGENQVGRTTRSEFEDFADLYGAASPSTDADKALVAAYWLQHKEGRTEFGSYAINAALKDLGHRVANITNAFGSLKAQKPQLAVQLRKSGTSKQARKTYKLTHAGTKAVESMISSEE